MTNIQLINNQTYKNKRFNLEERTLVFSKNSITFAKTLKLDIFNKELLPQYIRSSTSVGANYREANDALGKKDFLFRIKICRKEAKETLYWLELIVHANPTCDSSINNLIKETGEFIKIFSVIIDKINKKN